MKPDLLLKGKPQILLALARNELPQLTKSQIVEKTEYNSVKSLTVVLVQLQKDGLLIVHDYPVCPACGELLEHMKAAPKHCLVALTEKGVEQGDRIKKAADLLWDKGDDGS